VTKSQAPSDTTFKGHFQDNKLVDTRDLALIVYGADVPDPIRAIIFTTPGMKLR